MSQFGYDLRDPEGVKQYQERLETEFRYGCFEEKLPEICDRLGDFLENLKRDVPQARTVFELNCMKNNFGESCYKVGAIYGREDKWEKAYKLYQKGCENKSGKCCEGAALVHEYLTDEADGKPDHKGSYKFFEKACEYDHGYSCFRVSGMYMTGKEPYRKDMTKAFDYAKKACDLKILNACSNVHLMYKNGDGVAKNPERAEKYKEFVETVVKNKGVMPPESINLDG